MRLSRRRRLGAAGSRPTISALPLVVAGIGLLALIAPLRDAEHPLTRVGALLAFAGGLEVLHGVRRAEAAALRRAVTSGVITVLMGLLVINAPYLAGTALVLFLAVSFALDAVGYAGTAWRSTGRRARLLNALAALGNLAVAVLLLVTRARCRSPGWSRWPVRCGSSGSPGPWRSRRSTRSRTPAGP